jgi:hypothetical protein
MSTKSTTIRISLFTKERIELLDFVRKDTFDEILLKLINFYENHKKDAEMKSEPEKKESDSTTIRISLSTKEKIETLDFVRKDTFDEILLKLINFYEKNKKKGLIE